MFSHRFCANFVSGPGGQWGGGGSTPPNPPWPRHCLEMIAYKARLDKFWENQDVRYSWKAGILFTERRSNVELTID